MKSTISFTLTLSLALQASAFAADPQEMSPILREEFRITREELRKDLGANKKKLAELEQMRTRAVAASQKQAAAEKNWIEHLRKYDVLINARYSDEKGEFVPAMELSQRDIDNLNKLFEDYLRERPFSGRVTASAARKVLEQGQDKLKSWVSIHDDPSEKNNSDLEYIAKQRADAERAVNKIMYVAEQLQLDMKGADAAAYAGTAEAPKGRAPASR
jgi:hypothetical protein